MENSVKPEIVVKVCMPMGSAGTERAIEMCKKLSEALAEVASELRLEVELKV